MTSRIKLTQPFVLGLLLFIAAPAGAEKIRTAIPQANLNYLSIYVADAKGFFLVKSNPYAGSDVGRITEEPSVVITAGTAGLGGRRPYPGLHRLELGLAAVQGPDAGAQLTRFEGLNQVIVCA